MRCPALLCGLVASVAGQTCTNVDFVTTTGSWAGEVSWTVHYGPNVQDCAGPGESGYADGTAYTQTCCLPQGNGYELHCADSYGDGWNGGSITVGGEALCPGM
eukprot:gene4157-14078_t